MHKFGLINKTVGSNVPLESIRIRANVHGYTAQVVATMEYNNNEENPIEAIYIFPLDEQAAVCGFQATIDGRTIVAEIQEKQEARDTYDDAISSGHSAFLLEESDESSDIFQISVGNLPPKTTATVELTFVTELVVEKEGRVVFVLPTVLNPRYTPADSMASVTGSIPQVASVNLKYSFDFELKVQSASAIQEITSPCSKLKVEINPEDQRQAVVRLDEEYKFDVDVEVHVLNCEPFEPHALVENGVTKTRDGKQDEFLAKPVVMLNFFPDFKNSAALERGEFIFVIDRSGSMSGGNIKSARETLLLFLKSLPDGCYFNVIGFGSSFVKLFPKSIVYSDSSLTKASKLANSLDADLGGTEILEPLRDVFSQPLIKGYPRQVFLLTDGEVGNTQQVIDEVKRNAHAARCFAFGIGQGASTALVKGVARAGRGSAEFVTSNDRMQAKVIKILKNSLQPVLQDVKVVWDLPKGWSAQSIPIQLPPIFLGNSLVVYGLLDRGVSDRKDKLDIEGTATLCATSDQGEQSEIIKHNLKFTVISGSTVDSPLLLHRLAAKSSIREHQDEVEDEWSMTENQKATIIDMSKSANVVSKFTSFVAVDKESNEPIKSAMGRPNYPYYGQLQSMPTGGGMGGQSYPFSSQDQWGCAPGSTYMAKSVKPKGKGIGFPSFSFKSKKKSEKLGKKRLAMPRCSKSAPPPPGNTAVYGSPSPAVYASSPPLMSCDSTAYDYCTFEEDEPQFLSDKEKQKVKKPIRSSLELVSLQKASGAWQLTEQLASLCGVALDILKRTCPADVTADTKETVWATALALACLHGTFADKKDEWEMVAEKGSKWLKKNLSAGSLTYDNIMEKAAVVLGVTLL